LIACVPKRQRARDLSAYRRGESPDGRKGKAACFDGLSPNDQWVLDKFKFCNQIPTLIETDGMPQLRYIRIIEDAGAFVNTLYFSPKRPPETVC
jgi:hypothetical protein